MSDAILNRLHTKLQESFNELWDNAVDPDEPLYDADGTRWLPVGTDGDWGGPTAIAYLTEVQLREIRRHCRALALTNEFAINGHENRISYIVGSGHSYRATVKKGAAKMGAVKMGATIMQGDAARELPLAVQTILDEFIAVNHWQRRQQEIVRRRDRDGEVFLRFFVSPDGLTRVRFVEPGQVGTPPELAGDPSAAFGIQTERDDVETVLAYYIDGRAVDAAEIQHRKANVDGNVRRGLPLFFPVRKNLRRAEKLLRNMSVVAEIQSAIALIRRHKSATRTAVQQFVAGQADASITQPATGKTTNVRRYGPGTILDAPAGLEYDFPTAGLDAGNFVTVLQAELRAIASRLVMPEFMLTSDASNANFSSTMVAEGPALKMFDRLQAEQIGDDLAVMRRVVGNAIAAGRLPLETLSLIEIQAAPPSLSTRDQLKETQANKIAHTSGILSPQSWSQQLGLDYDQEQANFAAHGAASRS